MVKGKARAAGSFLGGLANNPAIVIIALVLGGLFIFKDRISGAFGSLGEGLGDINIQLPELKLPEISFPDFKFPEITFPDFPDLPDFQGLFTGFQEQFTNLFEQAGGGLDLGGGDKSGGIGLAGALAERRREQERALAEKELAAADIPLRDIADDIEGLTPAQSFAFIERGVIPTGFEVVGGSLQKIMASIITPVSQPKPIQSFLIDQPTQQFGGGGVSFIGGSIFETPLENLTLNQIINMFGVSASKAASLRAEAGGFEDIGGFIPPSFFDQGSQGLPVGIEAPDFGGFTGDPSFLGKTPEEIALILTGGNISNF